MGKPILQGRLASLRPADLADSEKIATILADPDVAQWWPRQTLERVRKEIINDPEVEPYAVEADGVIIGLLECYEEKEPDFRHAGMDIAIHPSWQGKGYGSDALRTLARHLFEDRGHHRLIIDPEVANRRAIHVYEKVGFKAVGVMRRYALGADGAWKDGLLMDLLPEELT